MSSYHRVETILISSEAMTQTVPNAFEKFKEYRRSYRGGSSTDSMPMSNKQLNSNLQDKSMVFEEDDFKNQDKDETCSTAYGVDTMMFDNSTFEYIKNKYRYHNVVLEQDAPKDELYKDEDFDCPAYRVETMFFASHDPHSNIHHNDEEDDKKFDKQDELEDEDDFDLPAYRVDTMLFATDNPYTVINSSRRNQTTQNQIKELKGIYRLLAPLTGSAESQESVRSKSTKEKSEASIQAKSARKNSRLRGWSTRSTSVTKKQKNKKLGGKMVALVFKNVDDDDVDDDVDAAAADDDDVDDMDHSAYRVDTMLFAKGDMHAILEADLDNSSAKRMSSSSTNPSVKERRGIKKLVFSQGQSRRRDSGRTNTEGVSFNDDPKFDDKAFQDFSQEAKAADVWHFDEMSQVTIADGSKTGSVMTSAEVSKTGSMLTFDSSSNDFTTVSLTSPSKNVLRKKSTELFRAATSLWKKDKEKSGAGAGPLPFETEASVTHPAPRSSPTNKLFGGFGFKHAASKNERSIQKPNSKFSQFRFRKESWYEITEPDSFRSNPLSIFVDDFIEFSTAAKRNN